MHLRRGIGKVQYIRTEVKPGLQLVVISDVNTRDWLVFRFPPNKQDSIFSEFQRAQNYGFQCYYSFIIEGQYTPSSNNIIRSLTVDGDLPPEWTKTRV